MVGVRDWSKVSARAALVIASLALAALLAACAAPTGSSGQTGGSQVAPTNAPVATAAPAATSAPAATTAPPATQAPAPTVAPTQAAAAAGSVSFSKDVMPIFQATCIKCHGGRDGTEGELSLKTYDDMMKGGEHGAAIKPGDASGSLLVKQIQNGKMPKRGQKLSQAQIDLIAKWVTEGAQNN